MSTTTRGRHQRLHADARVSTHRSHAQCAGCPTYLCPRHTPGGYAELEAKHRSDRP